MLLGGCFCTLFFGLLSTKRFDHLGRFDVVFGVGDGRQIVQLRVRLVDERHFRLVRLPVALEETVRSLAAPQSVKNNRII